MTAHILRALFRRLDRLAGKRVDDINAALKPALDAAAQCPEFVEPPEHNHDEADCIWCGLTDEDDEQPATKPTRPSALKGGPLRPLDGWLPADDLALDEWALKNRQQGR